MGKGLDIISWILSKANTKKSLEGKGSIQGDPGKSAYEIWLEAGHTGTQAQFLDSLKGADGRQGIDGAKGDKGEKGDKGDKGDAGEQGIQGNPGAQGEQGVKGDKGDKGDTGEQGIQGIQGNPGAKGEQGIQGEKGEKGDTGDQGIQGIQGIQGEKGDDGYPFLVYKTYDSTDDFDPADFPQRGLLFGLNDNSGNLYRVDPSESEGYAFFMNIATATALKGEKGDKGDQGEQGIQGEKGEKGDKGDQGDQGIQGVPGEQGEQGIPGEKGEKGDKGDNGAQGIQGIQGDKGEQGIQGEKGDDGSEGKSAYQVWLDAGHEGTEADFIEFIKGEKGDKGDTNTFQLGEPQAIANKSINSNSYVDVFTPPCDGVLTLTVNSTLSAIVYILQENTTQAQIGNNENNWNGQITMPVKQGKLVKANENSTSAVTLLNIKFYPFVPTTGEVVEQSYDPTSSLPISGVGVAEAVSPLSSLTQYIKHYNLLRNATITTDLYCMTDRTFLVVASGHYTYGDDNGGGLYLVKVKYRQSNGKPTQPDVTTIVSATTGITFAVDSNGYLTITNGDIDLGSVTMLISR